MRKLNNQPRKNDILRLRKEGKTYSEIQDILGCSKSTISYHCGNGGEKKRLEKAKDSDEYRFHKKVSAFKCRCSRSSYITFRSKVKTYKRRAHKNRSHAIVNNVSKNFTAKDVIDKIGKSPTCYLTGDSIDLTKPDTYHFDHITATSKGGTNDLSNLGLCTKDANYAKGNLSIEELHDLCEKMLKHRDEERE